MKKVSSLLEEIINTEGYADVGASGVGYQQLMLSKDTEIARLRRALAEQEAKSDALDKRVGVLTHEVESMTGLIAQVNEQVRASVTTSNVFCNLIVLQRREDQSYMEGMKNIYERRIKHLILNCTRPVTACDSIFIINRRFLVGR